MKNNTISTPYWGRSDVVHLFVLEKERKIFSNLQRIVTYISLGCYKSDNRHSLAVDRARLISSFLLIIGVNRSKVTIVLTLLSCYAFSFVRKTGLGRRNATVNNG